MGSKSPSRRFIKSVQNDGQEPCFYVIHFTRLAMGNPTLHSRLNLRRAAPLPEGRYPSSALANSTPLSVNHRVILTVMSAITPLLVLVNCFDQIRGAFVAVPMRPTLAMARPAHSGPDYLGIHAKLLWAYAPPGYLAQPRHCQPMVDP